MCNVLLWKVSFSQDEFLIRITCSNPLVPYLVSCLHQFNITAASSEEDPPTFSSCLFQTCMGLIGRHINRGSGRSCHQPESSLGVVEKRTQPCVPSTQTFPPAHSHSTTLLSVFNGSLETTKRCLPWVWDGGMTPEAPLTLPPGIE